MSELTPERRLEVIAEAISAEERVLRDGLGFLGRLRVPEYRSIVRMVTWGVIMHLEGQGIKLVLEEQRTDQ